MILSAQSIRVRCAGLNLMRGRRMHMLWNAGQARQPLPMLEPFEERTVHPEAGTTYGLGPCTYDVRIKETVVLRPGDFSLAVTLERFAMPLNVCATVMDKSSLVRRGLSVNNTHIDPGWQGWLTLELHNMNPTIFGVDKSIVLNAGWPVCQIKFEFLDQPTEQAYQGKYQNQAPVPMPAIHEKPL